MKASCTAPRPDSLFDRALLVWFGVLMALVLSACAALPGNESLRVNIVGIQPLQGEGLELRFAVKLRVLNPNDAAVEYDGVALELDLNGKALASGASDQKGIVPRYGETVLSVPVSISMFAGVRQAIGFAKGQNLDEVPYVLRGKLASGVGGAVRFSEESTLSWPQAGRMGG